MFIRPHREIDPIAQQRLTGAIHALTKLGTQTYDCDLGQDAISLYSGYHGKIKNRLGASLASLSPHAPLLKTVEKLQKQTGKLIALRTLRSPEDIAPMLRFFEQALFTLEHEVPARQAEAVNVVHDLAGALPISGSRRLRYNAVGSGAASTARPSAKRPLVDSSHVIRHFIDLSDAGDLHASVELARILRARNGPLDAERGYSLLFDVAHQIESPTIADAAFTIPRAAFDLAKCYLVGLGTEHSYDKAHYEFSRSAEAARTSVKWREHLTARANAGRSHESYVLALMLLQTAQPSVEARLEMMQRATVAAQAGHVLAGALVNQLDLLHFTAFVINGRQIE